MVLEKHEHRGCTYGWIKYKIYVTDCCFQIRFALAFAALDFRGHAKERKKERKKERCVCVFLHSCLKSEMQHLFRDLTAVRRLSFQVSPKQCVLFLQLQNPACQVNTAHTHTHTHTHTFRNL